MEQAIYVVVNDKAHEVLSLGSDTTDQVESMIESWRKVTVGETNSEEPSVLVLIGVLTNGYQITETYSYTNSGRISEEEAVAYCQYKIREKLVFLAEYLLAFTKEQDE